MAVTPKWENSVPIWEDITPIDGGETAPTWEASAPVDEDAAAPTWEASAPVDDWESKPSGENSENQLGRKSIRQLAETEVASGAAWSDKQIKYQKDQLRKFGWTEEDIVDRINFAQGESQRQRDKPELGDVKGAGLILAGTLDKALGHIPSSLYDSFTKEKEELAALDDIKQLSSRKLSRVGDAANIVGMFSGASSVAKLAGVAGRATKSKKLMDTLTSGKGLVGLGAAEGAAFGAGEARHGDKLEGAAMGAAFGAGAMGAGQLLSKASLPKFFKKSELDEDALIKHANSIDLDLVAERKLARESNEGLMGKVADYALDPKARAKVEIQLLAKQRLIKQIENPPKKLKEEAASLQKVKRYGEVFVRKGKTVPDDIKLPSMDVKALRTEIFDEMEEHFYVKAVRGKVGDLGTVKASSNFLMSLIDNLQVGKLLDGKFGYKLERSFTKLGVKLNHAKNATKEGNELIDEVIKKHDFEDLNDKQLLGKTGELSSNETAIKGLFDSLHEVVEKKFNIILPKQEGYIGPRVMKSNQEWLVAVDEQLRERGIKINKESALTDWKFDKQAKRAWDAALNSEEHGDFMKEMQKHVGEVTGTAGDMKSVEAAFNLKRAVGKTDEFEVKRLMHRDEKALHAPLWALERDVQTLAYRYIRDVAKGVAVRDELKNMEAWKDIAERSGDGGTSVWLGDVISDIQGKPRTTNGRLNINPAQVYSGFMDRISSNAMVRYQRGEESLKNQSLVLLPHMANLMTRMVYGNLLSKPISFMKNVASPYFSTFPYLATSGVGLKESAKIASAATLDTVKQLGRMRHLDEKGKVTPGFWKQLKEVGSGLRSGEIETLRRGLIHEQFSGEMAEKMANEAVRKLKEDKVMGNMFAKVDGMERMYANTLLYGFQSAETIARINSMNMAKRLAEKMAQEPEFGKKVLMKVDSPYLKSSKWADNIPSKNHPDFETFEAEMVEHINANTMFNYDRANMSGYGRTMGPIFSQFSKWPTMMLGKAVVPFAVEGGEEAMKRVLNTFLTPLAVTLAVNAAAQEADIYDDPTYKALVGDLTSYTTGNALVGAFKEDTIHTPASTFLFGAVNAAADPRKNLPDFMQNTWDYFGGGGAEKAFGAASTILTGEKFQSPSRKLTHSLRKTLERKKEK